MGGAISGELSGVLISDKDQQVPDICAYLTKVTETRAI
jgi:hypothetical protein